MNRPIERVAVLGAGVMGAQIAAFLAGKGVAVLLLDLQPIVLTEAEQTAGLTLSDAEVRNRVARRGFNTFSQASEIASGNRDESGFITLGNFADDLAKLADCDLVIEAIIEDLAIKRNLLKQVDDCRGPGTIVASNTSGLSIAAMAEGLSVGFRRSWLGAHFFNPVRFSKLLEVVPTGDTSREVVERITEFASSRLGKIPVHAKDTPCFIGNRIGVFNGLETIRLAADTAFTIEEIDEMTGPVIGRPRAATFRTMDLVGLGLMFRMADNIRERAPNDEMRETFNPPAFIREMAARNWLGDHSGQGFFKKAQSETGRKQTLTLDPRTMSYRLGQKPNLPTVEKANAIEDLPGRIRFLVESADPVGAFIWQCLSAVMLYSANRIPEIADSTVAIDTAMKWGFGWRQVPFETWDAIGVRKAVDRLKSEGRAIPVIVKQLLGSGHESFYQQEGENCLFFDFATGHYQRA